MMREPGIVGPFPAYTTKKCLLVVPVDEAVDEVCEPGVVAEGATSALNGSCGAGRSTTWAMDG